MNLSKIQKEVDPTLLSLVKKHFTLKFEKSDKNKWGCDIAGKEAIVFYCQTKYPEASLTHELLHFKLQINGYKRIYSGLAIEKETQTHLFRIIPVLDNELQHIKFFSDFIGLKYKSEHFYSDSDSSSIQYFKQRLQESNLSIIQLVVDFLSLQAPGGYLSYEQKEELENQFLSYNNEIYKVQFENVKSILYTWNESSTLNLEEFVIEFFKILNCGPVWIGYSRNSKDFPDKGFFVGNKFDEQDLYWLNK